jgi:hypothetical protein
MDQKSAVAEDLAATATPITLPEVLRSASTIPGGPAPQNGTVSIPPSNPPFDTPPPSKPAALNRPGSPAIAVVNVERLLATLLSKDASAEARTQAIRDIQRATAHSAAAHHFDLVLDISAKTPNGVLIVPSASGAFDLTEEISQELTR